jgi:hypothetical protein
MRCFLSGFYLWVNGIGMGVFRKLLGKSKIELKTSHVRQKLIFSLQFFLASPSHIVPLISQQNLPARNSHAGHFFFCAGEHFLIDQHDFIFF